MISIDKIIASKGIDTYETLIIIFFNLSFTESYSIILNEGFVISSNARDGRSRIDNSNSNRCDSSYYLAMFINSFFPIDHLKVLVTVLKIIIDVTDLVVISTELTYP